VDRNRIGLLVLNVVFLLALGGIVWNAARQALTENISWTEAKQVFSQGEVQRVIFEGFESIQLVS
jgi:hypothetical protein